MSKYTKSKEENPDDLGLLDNEFLVQIGIYLAIVIGIILIGSQFDIKEEKQEQQNQTNIEKVLVDIQKDIQDLKQRQK